MELRCDTVTAIPPPLLSWSKNPENLCSLEEIPVHWQKNDVLTFLADVGMYDATLYHDLDAAEKEQEQQFKSEYFKKRFTVSRNILRLVLHHIPGIGNNADIVLTKEKNGRVGVNTRPDIFISLSYSGSCIAITVGKRKIGSDIERVRPMALRKIQSFPLFNSVTGRTGKDQNKKLLHIWTLLESYAKFHDMSVYPLTHDRFLSPGTHFVSYLIDQRFILSLASDAKPIKDTLLWIDPAFWLASSGAGKNAAISSPLCDGDTYVRA